MKHKPKKNPLYGSISPKIPKQETPSVSEPIIWIQVKQEEKPKPYPLK